MTGDVSSARYIGDDWPFPLTYQDETGTAINLTAYTIAAALFVTNSATPVPLTVTNGGVILTDVATGQFIIKVAKSITSGIAATPVPLPPRSPTRLQVTLVDPSGDQTTLAVLQIAVLAP